jgi:hypothetical protein
VTRRALVAALVLAAGAAAHADTGWSCADNAELPQGELLLSNNVWNKGGTSGYEQCIALDPPGFLWRWRWPGGDPMPEAFPELVFGWQPWRAASTTDRLPRRLRDLGAGRVRWAVELEGDGVHNLALQLWLVAGARAEPDTVRGEVMVWLVNRGMTPAGSRSGALRLGADELDLHRAERRHDDRGVERAWSMWTLVSRRPRPSGELDLGALLGALREAHGLAPGLWLANVDLGTEIAAGSGRVRVRSFEVVLDRDGLSGKKTLK